MADPSKPPGQGKSAILAGLAQPRQKYAEETETPQKEPHKETQSDELELELEEDDALPTPTPTSKKKGRAKKEEEDRMESFTFLGKGSLFKRVEDLLAKENKRYLNKADFVRKAIEELLEYEEEYARLIEKQGAKIRKQLQEKGLNRPT